MLLTVHPRNKMKLLRVNNSFHLRNGNYVMLSAQLTDSPYAGQIVNKYVEGEYLSVLPLLRIIMILYLTFFILR